MIFDVIQNLCKQRGITVNQLENLMGVPQSSIQKIKKSVPKADRLYDIAQFFGVPMEDFFEDKDYDLDALKEWREFVDQRYNDLTPLAINKYLNRAAAGEGAYNAEYPLEEYEEYGEGFYLVDVCGNSMLPILHDGDVVVVQQQTETNSKDLSVVKVDGETATIKYVEITNNGMWLRAENKEVYEDRFYSIQDILTFPISVIGKVVEIRRKI